MRKKHEQNQLTRTMLLFPLRGPPPKRHDARCMQADDDGYANELQLYVLHSRTGHATLAAVSICISRLIVSWSEFRFRLAATRAFYKNHSHPSPCLLVFVLLAATVAVCTYALRSYSGPVCTNRPGLRS